MKFGFRILFFLPALGCDLFQVIGTDFVRESPIANQAAHHFRQHVFRAVVGPPEQGNRADAPGHFGTEVRITT